MQGNSLEVQAAIEIDRGYQVSFMHINVLRKQDIEAMDYSLQSWHNAAHTLSLTSRGRRNGSSWHGQVPIVLPVRLTVRAVELRIHVFGVGWRGEVTGSSREGE